MQQGGDLGLVGTERGRDLTCSMRTTNVTVLGR